MLVARQKIAITSSDDDVEAILSREPFPGPAERHVMSRKARSFHVHPRASTSRDARRCRAVAVVDVVVERRRQQVVGERDRREITVK